MHLSLPHSNQHSFQMHRLFGKEVFPLLLFIFIKKTFSSSVCEKWKIVPKNKIKIKKTYSKLTTTYLLL